MTDFPQGVNPGRPGDEPRLYELFLWAHTENGFGDVDHEHVRNVIAKGCAGVRESKSPVFGVIHGIERIEAVVGLYPERLWYNTAGNPENYFWTDLLFFVHPMCRRRRHHARLFRFCEWWSEQTQMRVVLNTLPREDLERKDKLFSRYGTRVGSAFLLSARTVH